MDDKCVKLNNHKEACPQTNMMHITFKAVANSHYVQLSTDIQMYHE